MPSCPLCQWPCTCRSRTQWRKKKVSVAEQNRTVSPKLKPFVKTLTWLPTRVLTSCSHSTDSHWNRLFAMCVLVSMITVLHCPFLDDISITIISTPFVYKVNQTKTPYLYQRMKMKKRLHFIVLGQKGYLNNKKKGIQPLLGLLIHLPN